MNKEKWRLRISHAYSQLVVVYDKIRHTNKKDTAIFLICLAISTTMWLLLSLSEVYTAQVRIPVTFSNIPNDRVVVSDLIDAVDIEVEAAGFSLVSYRLFSSFNPLEIDLSAFQVSSAVKKFRIPSTFINDQLSSHLGSQDRLVKVRPDSIFIEYSAKEYKKVPVVVTDSLAFRKQYFLENKVSTSPDSVELFGPAIYLAQISFVQTAPIAFTDVHETIVKDVQVMIPDSLKDVSVNVPRVTATWSVDQYTEGKVMIPISALGAPKNRIVKFFPDSAELTYQVGLNHFEQINANMFHVQADFSDTLTWKNRAKIRLKNTLAPAKVSYVRIHPTSVEFLFKQKETAL